MRMEQASLSASKHTADQAHIYQLPKYDVAQNTRHVLFLESKHWLLENIFPLITYTTPVAIGWKEPTHTCLVHCQEAVGVVDL